MSFKKRSLASQNPKAVIEWYRTHSARETAEAFGCSVQVIYNIVQVRMSVDERKALFSQRQANNKLGKTRKRSGVPEYLSRPCSGDDYYSDPKPRIYQPPVLGPGITLKQLMAGR